MLTSLPEAARRQFMVAILAQPTYVPRLYISPSDQPITAKSEGARG